MTGQRSRVEDRDVNDGIARLERPGPTCSPNTRLPERDWRMVKSGCVIAM